MKRETIKKLFTTLILFVGISIISFAGNDQRVGQAGGGQLLINPWVRTTGFGQANSASIHGLEALSLNVAGTAFTEKTELIFASSSWMSGSGINIYSFGLSQKVGETGVMSLSFMSMDFGDIDITTVDLPDGGLGTFHPTYTNITLAYAKAFSNSIYGGLALKILNEGISDMSSSGVALDAGIQYVTGLGKNKAGKRNHENLKFGMSMKNVGPTMRYKGDGLSFRGYVPAGTNMTVEQRSADYELPSLIKIGIAYDIYLSQKVDTATKKVTNDHTITFAGNFTSNSFTKDQIHFGLEYSYKKMFQIRGGYIYEAGIFDDTRATAYTGPTGGFSILIPLGKESKSVFSLDYSYRSTMNFTGVHSIGARITL